MRSFLIGLVSITAAGVMAYTVWVLTQPYSLQFEDVISSGGMIFLTLAATALGTVISANRKAPLSVRRAWLLMGLSAFCNAIAEGLWLYYENVLKVNPFPSIADVFYLLFYPLMLAGILNLPYTPIQRDRRTLLGLDMSIVMVVGTIFLWYFILAPMQKSGGEELANLVALAYPIADLFILAGLLSLIQRDLEDVSRTTLILLSSSMLFTAIADILFAILETYSIPYVLAPLNMLWMVSYWAMLAAAAWQAVFPVSRESIEPFNPLLRNTLVYMAPVLGMSLVFVSAISLLKLDIRLYGTLLGSFILITLVLVRQYLVLRDNRRLYTQMEQQAVTDALTGLHNRHFFNEAIQREVKRAGRYQHTLAILLIDVDNFKSYNDTHGHLKGDVLLTSIAAQLKAHIRSTEFLARFGGDEFVAILPETGISGAQSLATRMQQTISSRFAREHLGVSVGIAVLQPGMTAEALLAEADRSLYRAKPAHA